MDVHHPYLPPERFQRLFRDEPVEDRDAVRLRRTAVDDPERLSDGDLDTLLDLYDAEIRFTDAEIERLVETARTELTDPTVAVTADHGEHFLERGYFSGAKPYDVKLHVPLLVDGWGDAGRYDDLVGLCDLPPTLLDAAGLDAPSSYRGESLRRLVSGGEWERRDVVGGWGDDDERTFVCRTDDWKFVERPGARPDELYDLAADPAEETDVAGDYPDRVRQFRERLDRHREAVRATETDVEPIEREPGVAERLRRLGYRE